MKRLLLTLVLIVIPLMSGCRTAHGLVRDGYHILGALDDAIEPRVAKVIRKDIMAEQERLTREVNRFIVGGRTPTQSELQRMRERK